MATREPTARYTAPIQLATTRLPRTRWPVIAVPLLAFAVAFALDVATDRRLSQVWGGIAILVSAGVIPAVRRAAMPVTAYAGVWVGFNALRAVADDAGLGLVSRQAVSGLESSLFGGELPSAVAQRTLVDPSRLGATEIILTTVYLSFFVVPHVVAAVLLARDRALFWKAVGALTLLFGLGAVAFAVVPTNPPWLAATTDPALGDVDRLPRLALGELGVQIGDGTHGDQGYRFEPNPLASMPSIHLGVTVLIAAAAWRGRRFWRWLAMAYAVGMGIALVAAGEHYVLDVIVGAAVAVFAWAIAERVVRGDPASQAVLEPREQRARRSAPAALQGSALSFGRGTESRSMQPTARGAGDRPRRGA